MPESSVETVEKQEVAPGWLSPKQAEMYCGLSRVTLWRIYSSGAVKTARIGRAVRISRDSLDAYLESCAE